MKKNTKGYVKLSIILYIVILSVALVSTLAWFVFKQSATIDTEEDSKIVAGDYLEICLDDGDTDDENDEWTSKIGVANTARFPDVSVTPDGTVWYPNSLDKNDEILLDGDGAGKYIDVTATPEGYFVKLDLKVRSSKAVDVYLDSSSLIEGLNMEKNDAAIKENETDESGELSVTTHDTFSKDAIVGAARVAFFERNDSNEKTLTKMWVPNTKYHLNVEKKIFEDDCKCGPEDYKYLNVTDGTVKSGSEYGSWSEDDVKAKVMAGESALVTAGNIGDAEAILSFDEAGTKKITVYIWVEGTDRESNTILSGGSMKYSLTFVGIETKADSTYDINSVFYSEDGKLVYADGSEVASGEVLYSKSQSTDVNDWTPYASDAPIESYSELYIRANETATHKWGEIKKLK